MIILYNESHHIPTGGFIYYFYSIGITGVIVYGQTCFHNNWIIKLFYEKN